MGHKIKHTFALISLTSAGSVFAADFNLGVLSTSEDGGASNTYSIVYRPDKIGIRTHETRYGSTVDSRGLALDVQDQYGQLYVQGWVGRAWMQGVSLQDAQVEVSAELLRNLTATGAYEASTLYSSKLMPGVITYRSYTTSIDYNGGQWGGSIVGRLMDRSDGNRLSGGSFKVWRQILPGLNGYIHAKSHVNSSTNPLYFSPENYTRYGIGLGYRKFWNGSYVSLALEPGATRIDGSKENVLAWRGELNYKISDSARLVAATGRDYSKQGSYWYKFNQVTLKFSF